MAEHRPPFGSDFVLGLPAVGAPTVRSTDGAVAYVFIGDDAETLETSRPPRSKRCIISVAGGSPC